MLAKCKHNHRKIQYIQNNSYQKGLLLILPQIYYFAYDKNEKAYKNI